MSSCFCLRVGRLIFSVNQTILTYKRILLVNCVIPEMAEDKILVYQLYSAASRNY